MLSWAGRGIHSSRRKWSIIRQIKLLLVISFLGKKKARSNTGSLYTACKNSAYRNKGNIVNKGKSGYSVGKHHMYICGNKLRDNKIINHIKNIKLRD